MFTFKGWYYAKGKQPNTEEIIKAIEKENKMEMKNLITRGCHCCGHTCKVFELDECGENFKNWRVKDKHLWWSDKRFPMSMWQHEVKNDFTRLGYWEWVNSKWRVR